MQHTAINEQSFLEKLYHSFGLFYTNQPLLEITVNSQDEPVY